MKIEKEQKKDKKELTDFIQYCLDNGSTAPVIRQGVVEILNRHNSPANSRKISDVSFIASQINNNKTKVSFFTHKAGRGGWSEWVYPTKKYLFQCCDCNLVHEFQFGTFIKRNDNGVEFEVIKLPEDIKVTFRARRNKK